MQVVLWGTCFWVKHISKGLHQCILPGSLMAQMVKNLPAMQETPVFFLGLKIPWRRDKLGLACFVSPVCSTRAATSRTSAAWEGT